MRTVPKRRAGALLVLVVLLVPVLAPAPSAADALADKKAEAERLSRQLEQQARQVSILAEDYDEARVRIDAIEVELAAAAARVAKTDERASSIRVRLKDQAVEAYIRGGSTQALSLLVETQRTEDFAVRSEYIRTVTAGAKEVLDELRAVRIELDDQRDRLGTARADAKAGAALAESKRREAAAAEAAQRRTLKQVQGELAGLVEIETKRRADEEAARARAELASRQTKADAAARDAAAKEAARRTTTTTGARPAPASPGAAPTSSTAKSTTTTAKTTTTAAGGGSGSGSTTGSAPPPSAGAEAAIAEARRQIGKPYEWGGSGPDSFDCSGLTSWAWRAGGKSLPHSSRAQWSATSRVAITEIKPGDLMFYGDPIHHVGLYIGDGQMIEAPETGKNVRYGSIYRRDYTGAGRLG